MREAAEETGLVLADDDLVPFAHWIPPPEAPKRFSTWFFVAALPEGAADVVVDGGEIGDHVWTTPVGGARAPRAPARSSWPRRRGSRSGPGSGADGRRAPSRPPVRGAVRRHATRCSRARRRLVTVWEPDAAYESGDLDAPGARNRLHMPERPTWSYERD